MILCSGRVRTRRRDFLCGRVRSVEGGAGLGSIVVGVCGRERKPGCRGVKRSKEGKTRKKKKNIYYGQPFVRTAAVVCCRVRLG